MLYIELGSVLGDGLRLICDLKLNVLISIQTNPLKELVEPDGIEPTTSTMPL